MSLIPYDSFRQLEQMRNELDLFFLKGFGSLGTPSIDIQQTETEVIVVYHVPGLTKKEDVHIDIHNNMLSIRGTINSYTEMKSDKMLRQERFIRHFQQSVALPCAVRSEEIHAKYENDVLEIHIPKK